MRVLWFIYCLLYDTLLELAPYRELLKKALHYLEKEKMNASGSCFRVLDAGTGTGNLVAFSADSVFSSDTKFHGVDNSMSMLKRASKKNAVRGRANFLQADLNRPLPYRNDSFDAVVCINALYAVPNYREMLKEFARALKFGGVLVLANPNTKATVGKALKSVKHITLKVLSIAFINWLIRRRAGKGQLRFMDAPELVTLLKDCGFKVVVKEEVYGGTVILSVANKTMAVTDITGESLSVEVARMPEDMEKIYALRYDVYCLETLSLRADDYPDGLEKDTYDKHSVHIAIKNSYGDIVGTWRMVKDNPLGFVLETDFSLPEDTPRGKTLEHSRAIVRKDYRGRGLLNVLWNTARVWQAEHGYTICIGAASDIMKESLIKLGWQAFGKPAIYHNTLATPVMYKIYEQK